MSLQLTSADAAEQTFEFTAETPWIVSPNEPEPIRRALEDVKRDWYKVLGHVPVILSEAPAGWKGPLVYFGLGALPSREFASAPPVGRESFLLGVREMKNGARAIVATGTDVRGAIYAAYAFSETVLGVDPWWYWADKEPVYRGSIDVPAALNVQVGSPTIKYRGWFINDEDLLAGFSPDPLRENVFSLEMLDRVCETILRLRGNMIVPTTFAFPDERGHELAARRGLVLTMHHVSVLGLNSYRWPKDVPFSFTKHPEIMERYWQVCIDQLKDKEVVWSVGYRGKHDRPFWADEPEIATPRARGEVMARAIAKQVEMIRRAQPDAAIVSNMWEEGADFFRQGLITLPPGVTVVWPDDGTGLLRDDPTIISRVAPIAAGTTKAGAGQVQAGQGAYYHTAMLDGLSNQLSELVPPSRIYQEVGRFIRAGATEYFLLNVSDVRQVPLSTECAMKLAWDAAPYRGKTDQENHDTFILDWSRRQYGPEVATDMAALYREYFDAPSHRGNVRQGDHAPHRHMRDFGDEVIPLMQGGQPLSDKVRKTAAARLANSSSNEVYFSALLAKARALAPKIPSARRDFFQAHFLTALEVHLHSHKMMARYCQSLESLASGDRTASLTHLEHSLSASDAIFAALRAAETGKWAGWHVGEGLVGLDSSRHVVRAQIAFLRSESPPLPPAQRDWNTLYPTIYKYQERFQKNFPLLYGPTAVGR